MTKMFTSMVILFLAGVAVSDTCSDSRALRKLGSRRRLPASGQKKDGQKSSEPTAPATQVTASAGEKSTEPAAVSYYYDSGKTMRNLFGKMELEERLRTRRRLPASG